jgi:hypothetical protein
VSDTSAAPNGTTNGNGNGNGAQPPWESLRRKALTAATAGGGLWLVLVLIRLLVEKPDNAFAGVVSSYLTGFIFWWSLPIGSAVLLMIQYLVGGSWGIYLRKLLESATRTFPLLAVLFVPVLLSLFLGDGSPYWWTHDLEKYAKNHEHLEEIRDRIRDTANYLTVGFALLRGVFVVGVWFGIITLLNKYSKQAEDHRDVGARLMLKRIAGPGIITYALLATMFATDWVISLEETWASTMFPVIFAVNQILCSWATATMAFILLAQYKPLSEVIKPIYRINQGSFLLAFTLFWTYTSFSQFMLVWVGNLPEEIPFYLERSRGGWQYVSWALGIFHFACPFLLLLFRDIKKSPKWLPIVAAGLLVICFVDVLWWIEPALDHEGQYFFWLMDIAAWVGIGGLWLWAYLGQLQNLKNDYLPKHEAGLLSEGHHE